MTKRKRRPAAHAPAPALGEFAGRSIGAEHDGDVEIRVLDHGPYRHAVALPRGITRLGEEGLEVMHSLQLITSELGRLTESLAGAIDDARALGFSWASIGFCIGTTGEAARQRWGVNEGR